MCGRYRPAREAIRSGLGDKEGFVRVRRGGQDDFWANPRYFERRRLALPVA